MNKNEGITLIALVITVIILLILAGVAISMITGNSGLFAQANGAATLYNQKAQEEAHEMNELIYKNPWINEGDGSSESTPTLPTPPVPDLVKDSNVTFEYIPSGYVNTTVDGPVSVAISTTVTGYTLQYSEDGGSTWSDYLIPITTSEYGKVILARLMDKSTNSEGGVETANVTNIDVLGPKDFSLNAVAGATAITVSAASAVEDADATSMSGKSGIRGYQYRLENGSWTDEKNDTTYIFTGLDPETLYTVSMRAIDNAGNITEAKNNLKPISTLATSTVMPITSAITNDNIGEYIDLGTHLLDSTILYGTNYWGEKMRDDENIKSDYRVFYKDGDAVYLILTDYLPNSTNIVTNSKIANIYQVPERTYAVMGNGPEYSTFVDALKGPYTRSNNSTLVNALTGSKLLGKNVSVALTPTGELLEESYSYGLGIHVYYTDGTNLIDIRKELQSLYTPRVNFEEYDDTWGYWLASKWEDRYGELTPEESEELAEVWNVEWDSHVSNYHYLYGPFAIRPIVILGPDVNVKWNSTTKIWEIQ